MPTYIFQNPETLEFIEVFQKAKDEHIYTDSNGLEWNRIWTVPNASIDSQVNDGSREGFLKHTANKAGTMGDLWDASREAADKRKAANGGKDEVKKQWDKNYSKKRKGLQHRSNPNNSGPEITL
tara:strand:+ start:3096 stop:3467 length:372 start_codon:yes stop_codon:yes gene_type:complete